MAIKMRIRQGKIVSAYALCKGCVLDFTRTERKSIAAYRRYKNVNKQTGVISDMWSNGTTSESNRTCWCREATSVFSSVIATKLADNRSDRRGNILASKAALHTGFLANTSASSIRYPEIYTSVPLTIQVESNRSQRKMRPISVVKEPLPQAGRLQQHLHPK